jgi:hypothetical protein
MTTIITIACIVNLILVSSWIGSWMGRKFSK